MFDVRDGQLKISVRNLVEFFCRSGNIDNRFSGVTDKAAMEAGSRVHRKIQKSMGPDYRAEVPLSNQQECKNYSVLVEGRADGIFEEDSVTIIDEIKGTYKDIRYITEPVYVHKAQALCYAYFYAVDNKCDTMGIRLTYVNLDTEAIKYFSEQWSLAELDNWYLKVCAELCKFTDVMYEHRELRNSTIDSLKFPFEYREGQRGLAVSVYKAIQNSERLFIQAPTGVGKTISTIYPSVMSMGNGMTEKIFYLTAKTITRTAAEDTYQILRKNGLTFKTVTITAKDKICPYAEAECNPIACERARGHFDRVNAAIYELVTSEDAIDREAIETMAERFMVCPYEMSLDVSYFADSIICDYNYAFDPHVYLKRYFADNSEHGYVFLIDESHNLVERAREMYSAEVFKDMILEVKKLVKGYSDKLCKALDRCNSNMLELKRKCENEYQVLESCDVLIMNMQRLSEELLSFMDKFRDFTYMKELSTFYFDVMHFNLIAENLDENYITYCEHTNNGFMVRLFCVNPSENLRRRLQQGRGSVFFSATLLPVNYYKELLSGDKEDVAIYATSPFDTSKRLLAIGRDVTSRYTRRNVDEYTKIYQYIATVINAHPGNYLVFFPSYAYMNSVLDIIKDNPIEAQFIAQQQDMTEKDKEDFLAEFEAESDTTLVGLCVMGGVFSEGIDLKNDKLIGTIIVGTGLPSINTASQILRSYYDNKDNCGYDYAYVFPGMNKVLQAAGRVIRTDEDYGVIILLDDRFLKRGYQKLFPKEWENYRVTDINGIEQEILDFWRK